MHNLQKVFSFSLLILSIFFFSLFLTPTRVSASTTISSCTDLQNIANDLTVSYILGDDIDCTGVTFTPIGNSSTPFLGTFDGQNHQITNLVINSTSQNTGLFGYTDGATIINLTLESGSITSNSNQTGALAGYANNTTITSVSSKLNVTSTGIYTGGLVGTQDGTTAITLSSSTGNITGTVGGNSGWATGGLVGETDGGTIYRSYAAGNVIGEEAVGGLVGGFYGDTISQSFATGNIVGTDYAVGGLVGDAGGNIDNSYSTGSVTGENYVGGFVGDAYETYTNSYSTGLVTGDTYVGGFAYNDGGIAPSSFWDTQASSQTTNDISVLGLGRTTPEMKAVSTYTSSPQVLEPIVDEWTSISAGYAHTLALKQDGTLWAWGYNGSGQLGLGDTINRNTPTQVCSGTTWQAVSAGDAHTLALKQDGTLWAWGYNGYGQLGLGDTTDRHTPTQVGSGITWQAVSAGDDHTLALKQDGTFWSWG